MKKFGLLQIVLIVLVAGALSCSTTRRPSTPLHTKLIHYLKDPDGRPVKNHEVLFAIFSKDGREGGAAESDASGRVDYGMSLDSGPQEYVCVVPRVGYSPVRRLVARPGTK